MIQGAGVLACSDAGPENWKGKGRNTESKGELGRQAPSKRTGE